MTKRLLALVMLATACSGEVAESSTTTDDSSTTTSVVVTTTSTAVATTTLPPTTTVPPTTLPATGIAEAEAAVVFDLEVAEGWMYTIAVRTPEAIPDASPGGCIEVAPPGQTNLWFDVAVVNQISDRPAPSPEMVFQSNLVGDGTIAAGIQPFGEGLADARTSFGLDELSPNEGGKSCLLASGIGVGATEVEPGGVLDLQLTIGPVIETETGDLLVGLRMFTDRGITTQAIFGVSPGSGQITRDIDVLEELSD